MSVINDKDSLFELKSWLTLKEAAKALSGELDYKIKKSDVFRYALDQKLKLSVNFAGAVSGKFGYYQTEWTADGVMGITRFLLNQETYSGCLNSEAFELDSNSIPGSVGRQLIDHIEKRLRRLAAYPLPAEGGLIVNIPLMKHSEIADRFYQCYGTVFQIENVSYNEETEMLQSRTANGRTIDGSFVITTQELKRFIESVKDPLKKHGGNLMQNAPVTRKMQRRNNLDPAIDKAIEKAGNMKLADVYLELKELALDGEKPFTGTFSEKGALDYTNDDGEITALTKDALGKRLNKRL